MKQSLWPLQHLPSETAKSADFQSKLLVNTSIGILCFLLTDTCLETATFSTLGWTFHKCFIFPLSLTIKECTWLIRENSLTRTAISRVSETDECSFPYLTDCSTLLFAAHQLIEEVESGLVQYATNLFLVLALTLIYCMTFVSTELHFPSPDLSYLALFELNSSRGRLLLIITNSFA